MTNEEEADAVIEKLKAPPKKTIRTLSAEWGFEITETMVRCFGETHIASRILKEVI